MSVDHKRPMYAFVMVALICGLVIADQVRSEAQWGPEQPFSVVAGADFERLPTSDPPVPGQPRRTTGEQTEAVETPAAPAARQAHPAPSAAPSTSATAPSTSATAPAAPQAGLPEGGLPEGGAPGSPTPPVEVVVPAPQPQAPAAGGQGPAAPGQGASGGVLGQLDLGETVQQVLQSAASPRHPGRGHAYGHGKGHGHGVAGVRGAEDEATGVDAGAGHDASDAVTDADASDEVGAPVLDPGSVIPGWLEETVSPRSAPAPRRP